ncbi:hypothetical protein C7974DRAFT_227562 [Boeremia exigua]|uniref:uncharacterized protein n=1 Tax=Boeremia exigua TaxID=749465 RepID=UPI001E8E31E0|nr:uncharacterized protein C7974DRAFT_227562 [Boeremia exigua]KAH6620174.1 hypothetical protein C7974DRAFT_227562 [Boeremia exigua]
MPRLPDRASAEEARAAAGFSEEEWRRFIDITKDIARGMQDGTPDIRWRRVPFNLKRSTMDRINDLLAQEGIPVVEIDLIGWRMSRAIGNLKQSRARVAKAATTSANITTSTDTTTDAGVSAVEAPAATASGLNRGFDAVRDAERSMKSS